MLNIYDSFLLLELSIISTCYFQLRGRMILHFFLVELTKEQFLALERNAVHAEEYGKEVSFDSFIP